MFILDSLLIGGLRFVLHALIYALICSGTSRNVIHLHHRIMAQQASHRAMNLHALVGSTDGSGQRGGRADANRVMGGLWV